MVLHLIEAQGNLCFPLPESGPGDLKNLLQLSSSKFFQKPFYILAPALAPARAFGVTPRTKSRIYVPADSEYIFHQVFQADK